MLTACVRRHDLASKATPFSLRAPLAAAAQSSGSPAARIGSFVGPALQRAMEGLHVAKQRDNAISFRAALGSDLRRSTEGVPARIPPVILDSAG
jgi:hypothetical protein